MGTCLFQVATFVEERAKVFFLHGAWAIWKRHVSSVVLHQMQCEMNDTSLSGVQEETQASSIYPGLPRSRRTDFPITRDATLLGVM
jgi:hypothetical protein